jgi:hypothetical protein
MPPSVTFFGDGANRRPAGLSSGTGAVRRARRWSTPLRLTVVVRFWFNLKLSRVPVAEVFP